MHYRNKLAEKIKSENDQQKRQQSEMKDSQKSNKKSAFKSPKPFKTPRR